MATAPFDRSHRQSHDALSNQFSTGGVANDLVTLTGQICWPISRKLVGKSAGLTGPPCGARNTCSQAHGSNTSPALRCRVAKLLDGSNPSRHGTVMTSPQQSRARSPRRGRETSRRSSPARVVASFVLLTLTASRHRAPTRTPRQSKPKTLESEGGSKSRAVTWKAVFP